LKKEESSNIHMMNCSAKTTWQNLAVPICIEIPENDCEKALNTENIGEILSACEFEFSKPENAIKITEEGILIQGLSVKVTEDTKVVTKSLPIVIYSNKKVTVTLDGQVEISYPAIENVTPKILVTKLAKTDLITLLARTIWTTFWRDFDFERYIKFINLGLLAIFSPVSLTALIVACCNRKKVGIERKAKRGKKSKKERKDTEKENLRLLQRARK
jgi:hypothetical protein